MSSTEQTVSAVQAAWLVRVSQQTIRAWIKSGKLPVAEDRPVQRAGEPATWQIRLDDLANVPGVEIDQDRLRTLGPAEFAARVEKRLLEIERRLAASEVVNARDAERIAQLEQQLALIQDWRELVPPSPPPAALPPAPPALPRAPITLSGGTGTEQLRKLKNWQDRGIFLAAHGWAMSVTKSWRDDCPLNPREAVLRWALEREARLARTGPRPHLHACTVADCPCHDLFASLSRAADDENV